MVRWQCLPLVVALLEIGVHSLPWPAIPSYSAVPAASGPVYVYPTEFAKGFSSKTTNLTTNSFSFTSSGETYTLDYGRDVAGKVIFSVDHVEGYAQIEIRYSESYPGILSPQGDGPFAFANALAGTFRVETYNITSTGSVTGYFIQGSQRWLSITLVAGSNLTISGVGFESSVDETPMTAFPGYFASSNQTYTDIWALGPRTQQLVCYGPGTQTATWEITENGAYVRGQKPASSARVINASNYTLTFEAMIDYGGVGWRVDTEIDAVQATGPILVMTSEYPAGSFANIDRELLPPNTLVLGRGWSLQNQTSLPAYVLDKFPLSINVTEKAWHTIDTISYGDDTYEVRLDGQSIASFNISSYGIGDPNPYIPGGVYKGFALGPFQDQAAFYRNVNMTLNSGKNLYYNPMTSEDVLVEYGVQTMDDYSCSDSGKRDRYAWLGDRLISSRAVLLTTGQQEFVWGPALSVLQRQTPLGQVPISTLFSPETAADALVRTTNVDPLVVDYTFDLVQISYNYWLRSGNLSYIEQTWEQMIGVVAYAMSRALDADTQLYGAPTGSLGVPLSGEKGQALGPANTVSMILSLERMADLATLLNKTNTAATYRAQAYASRAAIDDLLWNATAGYYASTIGAVGYDLMDIAQVLLAQIGTSDRRTQFLKGLDALRLDAGYMNGTRFADTPAIVDPYYMSFLLEGLAIAGETALAQDLLDRTWSPMVRRDRNYTGGYWEYVSPDGVYPGLDLFTGQSHFWGSFPTTFLTEYALGIRPLTAGYATFAFAPLSGFQTEWVHGRVPTPAGLIYASWGVLDDGKMAMQVEAPAGLTGQVTFPWNGTVVEMQGGNGAVLYMQA